jgi:peptide/nickel transport system permease protein
MTRLIAIRLGLGLLTLLAVSVLMFAVTEILPGDVATTILGQQATPEAVALLRAQLGLDRPAGQRYVTWLFGVLHGDFGRSLANDRLIVTDLAQRFGNTLFLAAYAAAVAVPLSLALGVAAAIREGGVFDRMASVVSLVSISMPEFFVGYVLIILFAVKLGWLPSLAIVHSGMGFWTKLQAATLPALALVLVVVAHMLRMTRASVLAVMASPHVEMAFLKGLSRARVIIRHALPNAMAPIVAVVGLNLAYLVVGVVVIEVVFVYPGVGHMMVDAVAKRDLPVVQACALAFAATFVGLNTIADVIAILANPRLRHPR